MEIFINECSLHGQYKNNYEFNESVKNFVASLNIIFQINNAKFYKSRNLYSFSGIKGKHFETCLKAHHSINELFVQNLQIANPKIWENEQVHNSSFSYVFEETDYVEKSLAELAERKDTNGVKGLLLNFRNSIFSEHYLIEVVKGSLHQKQTITVACADTTTLIHNWLVENDYLKPDVNYDEESPFPPADYQTILANSENFVETKYRNQGRKMFRKINTNELWVVDTFHKGKGAHCEVFDEKSGKHLGTSPYNEMLLNKQSLIKGRKINQ